MSHSVKPGSLPRAPGLRRARSEPAIRREIGGSPNAAKKALIKSLKNQLILIHQLEKSLGKGKAVSKRRKHGRAQRPLVQLRQPHRLKPMVARNRDAAAAPRTQARGRVNRSDRPQRMLMRRSSASGVYKLASHSGMWQPPQGLAGTPAASGSGSIAQSPFGYLVNNRVAPKSIGSAKYFAIPGMSNQMSASQQPSHLAAGLPETNLHAPMLETPRNEFTSTHASQGGLHARHKHVKTRMGRMLAPSKARWLAAVEAFKSKNGIINEGNWNDLHLETLTRNAAGGGGGDLGRVKRDTGALQDLLTTEGYRYGDKLFNAALDVVGGEKEAPKRVELPY